jgi:hypothetical protein
MSHQQRPESDPDPENDGVDWDAFDTQRYFESNYETLLRADREILEIVRDFFGGAAGSLSGAHGLDAGTGGNLYPALAMLPYCSRIDLIDRSRRNLSWLRQQVNNHDSAWDHSWKVLADGARYTNIVDPRRELAKRARVRRANVLELPSARWDIGTMFFVACSMSSRMTQFELAVHRFVRALRPGAPFAAAFMKESCGYTVGAQRFPAVAVNEGDVAQCLRDVADRAAVWPIALGDASSEIIRPGYTGMIVATGRRRR